MGGRENGRVAVAGREEATAGMKERKGNFVKEIFTYK